MKKDQNILKQGNMACLSNLRCFSKTMAQIIIWKQWEMTTEKLVGARLKTDFNDKLRNGAIQ